MKARSLYIIIICALILTSCNKSKPNNTDIETNENTPTVTKEDENIEEEKTKISPINLDSEDNIKNYLIGQWIFDKEDKSDIICKMDIDENLNINLSFYNSLTNDSKGDYRGEIIFDRQYSSPEEAPDLISIELIDSDYPGGDFYFLHRTNYDEKYVMSLFFAGNGNCIFDMLGPEDHEYAPEEIMFEKESSLISQIEPRKNDEFYAVFWGRDAKGEKLWLDDVLWTPIEEYNPDPAYPEQMINYKNDVKESSLYSIAKDKSKDMLGEDLLVGEVYSIKTDRDGNIIDFETAEYKEYIDIVNNPDNNGYALFENTDIGEKNLVRSIDKDILTKESGPFRIKITNAQIIDFKLADEYKESFANQDKLTILTIAVEVTNNSTKNNWINPLLGYVAKNEEEIEANFMWSDDIGGEFAGQATEKGTILFIVESESKDIKNIKYTIEGAKDKDFNSIGEDVEFELEFK